MKKFLLDCNRGLFVIVLTTALCLFMSCSEKTKDTADYNWVKVSIPGRTYEKLDTLRLSPLTKQSKNFAQESGKAKILKAPQGLKATGLAFLNDKICVVSYHGENNEYKGAVELMEYNSDGFVRLLGGMDFNYRVNNVIAQGNRIFAGMDTKNGPVLIAIEIDPNTGGLIKETYNGVRLNGVSVNGLLYSMENGTEYIYSATGGSGKVNDNNVDTVLSFDGKNSISQALFLSKPGFQKTKVEGSKLTPIVSQGNANNRGKWVAKDGKDMVTMHFSKYNNFSHITVQYYSNYIDNFISRDFDQKNDIATNIGEMEAKNMCILTSEADAFRYKYLYICASSKGLLSFKLDKENKNMKFINIDAFGNSAYAISMEDGKAYIACGTDGVKVASCREGVFSPYKHLKFSLDTQEPSANYILTQGNVVYIAYGKQGVVSIPKDDALFIDGSGI